MAVMFLATPLVAWADARPDFDEDAAPILRMQPGLLQYVHSRYDVKDTGTAKYPGDDDHPPGPPFIFEARPLGSNGPYNLRLLIQPGPPGHVLGVVDITKVHLPAPPNSSPPPQPSVAQKPAPSAPQAPAASPQPASQPSAEPTADTPSGPITGSGSQTAPSNSPSLAPPPDPAPVPR